MSTIGVTPELLSQYNVHHEAQFQSFLNVIKATNWTLSKEEPTIQFYSGNYPNSSFSMIKSIVTIPLPVEEVFNFLLLVPTIDDKTPDADRDGCRERRLFGEIPNDEHHSGFLYVWVMSGSRFVSDRDFSLYRRAYDHEDMKILFSTSIENLDIMPEKKGNVRGKMNLQAFICQKDPNNSNQTQLTFVVHADPMGSIPSMIYNSVAVSQGYSAKKVRDNLMKPK